MKELFFIFDPEFIKKEFIAEVVYYIKSVLDGIFLVGKGDDDKVYFYLFGAVLFFK